jgi:hypothetical protein
MDILVASFLNIKILIYSKEHGHPQEVLQVGGTYYCFEKFCEKTQATNI